MQWSGGQPHTELPGFGPHFIDPLKCNCTVRLVFRFREPSLIGNRNVQTHLGESVHGDQMDRFQKSAANAGPLLLGQLQKIMETNLKK